MIGGLICPALDVGYTVFFGVLLVVQVLAHASAWALTEYKRVVLLADNMLVVENIDDLFQCPGICAGELFGSGVFTLGQEQLCLFFICTTAAVDVRFVALVRTSLTFTKCVMLLFHPRDENASELPTAGGLSNGPPLYEVQVCILRWMPVIESNEMVWWALLATPSAGLPSPTTVERMNTTTHVRTPPCES